MLQGRLAHELGVSQQSLSGYESGRWRVPDDVAAKLARLWRLSEVDVRKALGLYVPSELDGDTEPLVPVREFPDDALRLPKGVKLSDLDPREQKALETIVDAFIDQVRRELDR